MSCQKSILIITPVFRPSVGGAETYINELCEYLRTHNYYVYVLTYQPIADPKHKGKKWEKLENMEVRRYQWIASKNNLFHKLEKSPLLLFLYITPYLLLRSLLWCLKNHQKIDLIDGQGLNCALIAKIFKKIFRKKAVATILAIYNFVPGSKLVKKVLWILHDMEHIIVESEVSKKEMIRIGIPASKITPYVEWVDLNKFKPRNKKVLRKRLALPLIFTVLFVARAIKIKGADLLLGAAERMRRENINFVFISRDGPMVKVLKKAAETQKNITFIEGVDYGKLPLYYAASDLFVIPSRYAENAARTVVEAISCGTPVVGSNRGAIPSLIHHTVGILVEPAVQDLAKAIEKLYTNQPLLHNLTANCRPYAEKKFSPNNARAITNVYKQVLDKEKIN